MRDIRERKLAEKTLCENDVQLSNALQIARAGNWTYDVATDQFTFNDNFYRIFRTTAAEVGGYTMTSAEYTRRFVYPEDAAVVANETELALRSPNPNYSQEIEHRIIFKGGEIGYMAVRFFIVKDQAGKTVKTYGVNQDITQRKRDEGTLRRLNRTLRALSGASTLMVRATSEQQLLDDMCQVIVEVGGYALAWIAQPDDTKFVTPIAHAGAGAGYLENIQIRWDDCVLGRGPTGAAIRTGKVQVNRDFAANPLMRPWLKDAQAYGFCSSISLPLKGPSSTFGALVIYSAASDVFDAEEVELLTELSRDLTYGILALRDHIGREEALKGLQSSLEATVEALANTAERRDPYTAGHQRRVAEIAEAIARRMRLPESQVQGIRLAGIIHDVGKVQVPTEILSKPGRISPLEFELIKEHSQAGYDIVKRIEFPWPIADIILQHHERIDGSGYPNGLKGDAIMLEAKIIAVADTVEAMMSHRPYRPALGLDAALAEIERGKGLIYDPSVAEACLALFREDGFTMTRDSSPA
jgi:putative nucleotidyltransferase with HDIG domain